MGDSNPDDPAIKGGQEPEPGGDDSGSEGGQQEFQAITSQQELDRILGQRLNRERQKFGDYDELKRKAGELDAIRDGEKSELQKATERADQAEREAATLRHRDLQREVAAAKGVPAKHAHRLQGGTREELEADADDYLTDYTPPAGGDGGGRGGRIAGKPRENLRGGGAPDDKPAETDPRKLAQAIPRTY